MTTSPDPRKNQLLAALPEPELPHLEYVDMHVDMRLGEVLYEAGSILSHVYFPTTGDSEYARCASRRRNRRRT